MVLYYIPFSIGFCYMSFFTVCINYRSTSSYLVCISMVLVLFLIFLSRLLQYASISKMINGALFMNILFSVLCHTFMFWFSKARISVCSVTLCSSSTCLFCTIQGVLYQTSAIIFQYLYHTFVFPPKVIFTELTLALKYYFIMKYSTLCLLIFHYFYLILM